MGDNYSEVVKGETKVYDKEVAFVIEQPDGTKKVQRAFICPSDWRFVCGSAK